MLQLSDGRTCFSIKGFKTRKIIKKNQIPFLYIKINFFYPLWKLTYIQVKNYFFKKKQVYKRVCTN